MPRPNTRPIPSESPNRKPRRDERVSGEALGSRLQHAAHAFDAAGYPVPVPTENPAAADEDDEDWTAPTPEDHPDDVAAAGESSLCTREVSEEDLDRLWDWIRQDADRGEKFLGSKVMTSLQLRDKLVAWGLNLHSLDDAGEHVGFGGFHPVLETHVGLHLYLAPSYRSQLARLIPQFLKMAQTLHPGKVLTVATQDEADVRLYRPFGFVVSYVVQRAPPMPVLE